MQRKLWQLSPPFNFIKRILLFSFAYVNKAGRTKIHFITWKIPVKQLKINGNNDKIF